MLLIDTMMVLHTSKKKTSSVHHDWGRPGTITYVLMLGS